MQKFRVLTLCFLLLLTGCSIIRLDDNNLEVIVNTIISHENRLSNVHFDGHQFYLPRNFRLINRDRSNIFLLDRHNNRYFMYVDAISFYHNVEKEFTENPAAYFSKGFESNGRFGYLEINQVENKYFIEAMFHYTKIEVFVNRENIIDAVSGIFTILNSVEFNQIILESLIGDNRLDYTEEVFDIFETRRRGDSVENFLRYIEEFDRFDDINNQLPDEDSIRID